MKVLFVFLASILLLLAHLPLTAAFKSTSLLARKHSFRSPSLIQRMSIPNEHHPHCDLPGDPSLILTTNVDLGDKKGEILKTLSALVASSTGKPESYVAVCITDKASMCFGGSDDPLALGCVYSLGKSVLIR
jgi:phenylpyruvate tautomerase PptA (4-oxalocrotonate tautomerase family)